MITDDEVRADLDNDADSWDALTLLVSHCQGEKGSVVPVVGAGLSRPFGYPLWGDFLKQAAAGRAELLASIEDLLKKSQYEEAASKLVEILPEPIFNDKFDRAFGRKPPEIPPGAGAVTYLPRFARRVITTNFDRVLESVYRAEDSELETVCGSQAAACVGALQQGKPFLLKLHGDWNDPDNRVLTLEEYTKAYGSVTPEQMNAEKPLPDLLSTLLKSRLLLFLGCSLEQDRTVRVMQHVTKQFGTKIFHIALVEQKSAEDHEKRRKELSNMAILPIWYVNTDGRHSAVARIMQYLAEKVEEVFPPLNREVPDNLPILGNETIGRATEIDDINGKLRPGCLVTVVGAGGCGKTRVAIEAARAAKERYPSGVWYVGLAKLSPEAGKDNLLPTEIGKVVGVAERPSLPPNEGLLDFFRQGKHLLVLDNCEHLRLSCRDLVEALLGPCKGLSILATSRTELGLESEQLYPLEPLGVPEAGEKSPVAIEKSSAVQLFLARARTKDPEFQLDESKAKYLAQIAQALGGIPLGVELAAAQLKDRTVLEIWEGTKGLFDEVLPDGVLRHADTLRSTIQWSYDLLTPDAQLFLRSLSVFAGGWNRNAARAVCSEQRDGVEANRLTSVLSGSSLIVQDEVLERKRFRFLEPIRQFAAEKLKADERVQYERQHVIYFASLAEESSPKFLTGEQDATLASLQPDLNNFREAFRRTVAGRQPELGLKLMAAFWRFLEIRDYYTEGLAVAESVLAIPGSEKFPLLRCKVLSGAGMLAYRMGEFGRANQMFEKCREIAEMENDPVEIADALSGLGLVAMMQGNFLQAKEFQIQCRDLEKKNGNARNEAVAIYNLGFILLGLGDAAAADSLETSREQFESTGNHREAAFALESLARCAIVAGDLKTAKDLAQQSLDTMRNLLDNKHAGQCLQILAWAAIEEKEDTKATSYLQEAISFARAVEDSRGISEALDLFALVSVHQNDFSRAVKLAAAAGKLRGNYGYALPPALVSERERALQYARTNMGEASYGTTWDEGGKLELGQAVAFALGK